MRVLEGKCIGCGTCMTVCSVEAIDMRNQKAHIDRTRCIRCRLCMVACNKAAVQM